jgi:biopolymer transport protein ExbD/biopolymer transport protein TolR
VDFGTHHRRRTLSDINLTPLIDIVFNLLIFFLITTTFVQNPGIEVDLPKATSSPTTQQSDNVVIAITSDGRIIHEGKAVSVDELGERLREHHKQRPQALVIVEADTATSHGKVVAAMDAARQAGFSQLAIATAAK